MILTWPSHASSVILIWQLPLPVSLNHSSLFPFFRYLDHTLSHPSSAHLQHCVWLVTTLYIHVPPFSWNGGSHWPGCPSGSCHCLKESHSATSGVVILYQFQLHWYQWCGWFNLLHHCCSVPKCGLCSHSLLIVSRHWLLWWLFCSWQVWSCSSYEWLNISVSRLTVIDCLSHDPCANVCNSGCDCSCVWAGWEHSLSHHFSQCHGIHYWQFKICPHCCSSGPHWPSFDSAIASVHASVHCSRQICHVFAEVRGRCIWGVGNNAICPWSLAFLWLMRIPPCELPHCSDSSRKSHNHHLVRCQLCPHW